MRKTDAFQAINSFLLYLNLDFRTLLTSPAKSKEREVCKQYLDILIETDEICRRIGLSDLPIYQSLAGGGVKRAEEMVGLLHQARRIYNGIKESTVIFPEYLEDFVEPAIKKMSYWERLDKETICYFNEILNDWQDIQNQYDELTERLSLRSAEIAAIGHKDRRVEKAVDRINKDIDKIHNNIRNGSMEATEGIDELQRCYDDLSQIKEQIKGTTYSDAPPGSQKSPMRDKIEQYLSALDLMWESVVDQDGNIDFSRIKKAYREHARRYHPDIYFGSDAQEKMQAINMANDFLNDHLSRGVDEYV